MSIQIQMIYRFNLIRIALIAAILASSAHASSPDSLDVPPGNHIKFELTYGKLNFLPSLAAYSKMPFDFTSKYSDAKISTIIDINQFLTYSGQLEITDQPPWLLGTIHSRPDYFISTGRFQRSELRYEKKSFKIHVGRGDFFDDIPRSDIYQKPINGDGLSWAYTQPNWSFKHVIASLPSKVSKGVVFRRVLNYHQMSGSYGRLTYGAGEYFILTGPTIGLELKRLNPFVPYSRNSHDSFYDLYPGYVYDSDNTIIKFFLFWRTANSLFNISFYVDEFQVDKEDRINYNDALLLNLLARSRFKFDDRAKLALLVEGNISISNPNFSDHPGPATSAISGIFPILESSPGAIRIFYIKTQIEFDQYRSFILSYHHEQWVDIATLPAELRNQRQSLDILPVINDSKFTYSYRQEIKNINLSLIIQGWRDSYQDENYGARIGFVYNYKL